MVPAVLMVVSPARAQEVVTGTYGNPKLNDTSIRHRFKSAKSNDTIQLSFYDDFSSGKSLPDEGLWEDKYVFINNTFSVNQLTQGMATFDALDETGALYGNASYSVFAADTLTSKPINLAYNVSDSAYLSFLYEPGGIADNPEENDSLTLEFYAPLEKEWQSVWRTKGGGKARFKQVMIGITSEKFLKKGFRFRFTNYASLSGVNTEPSKAGSADQWNLDCVILDTNRFITDTIMPDVAFTTPARSFLTNIEAMPWNQYKLASRAIMNPSMTLAFRNNDTTTRNPYRFLTITDVYKNQDTTFNLGNDNIAPLTDIDFNVVLAPYKYKSTMPDSALFLVKSILRTSETDDPKGNDTIRFLQFFGDYFAYDDGTAEAGYGINGEGSDNAMVALRFRSYMADSVAAISICFNDAFNNANQRYFSIIVWADKDGKPGSVIATQDGMLAEPSKVNNGFITYRFDQPAFVNDYFWVGWKQSSETFLNVGLDMNTPHQNRQYYWLNGSWYASSVSGTVLMRAVMSGKGTGTSSDDDTPVSNMQFKLFPNPSSSSITLSGPDNDDQAYKIAIYSLNGSLVMLSEKISDVDISRLSPGNYILVVKSSENRSLAIFKLIKSN